MKIQKPTGKEGLVDAAALAKYYGVSIRTVLLWAERGEIPVAVRMRRIVRFDPDEVEQVLRGTARRRGGHDATSDGEGRPR